MKRFLPPLLVVLVLGLVLARMVLRPARAEERAKITASMGDSTQVAALETRLDRYLAEFTDPEDRWFVADAYLRLGSLDKAFGTIWDGPTLAPGTARRFAAMALRILGWEDAAGREPTPTAPSALIVLVEGGNAWATEQLREIASTAELAATTPYLFIATNEASSAPLDLMIEAYRARGEEAFALAAALSAMGPAPYPEREADLALLLEALRTRRIQHRNAWGAAAVALGRSEDPEALEALRAEEKRLARSSLGLDEANRAVVWAALVAGGDWKHLAALEPYVFGAQQESLAAAWYTEAVLHRFHRGDPRAREPLGELWLRLGPSRPEIRTRLAHGLLLEDDLPRTDDEMDRRAVDHMLRDLTAPGSPPDARVLALAYQLRTGMPGARGRLLDLLRTESGMGPDGDARSVYVPGLRALYLYD